ncbi:MAG: hypothetical protein ACI8TX_001167 [Hyphomicrobiaceae bacterium]|jgi:uncharacterized protein (DUF427 family)
MTIARWNGVVVAESDECRTVEGNAYFPAAAIRSQYFESSSHLSVCPWKGTASYYHLVVDGQRNEDAAWFYPETKPKADNIRGYIAFWKGVQVQE